MSSKKTASILEYQSSTRAGTPVYVARASMVDDIGFSQSASSEVSHDEALRILTAKLDQLGVKYRTGGGEWDWAGGRSRVEAIERSIGVISPKTS